jgi:hypothetical protein
VSGADMGGPRSCERIGGRMSERQGGGGRGRRYGLECRFQPIVQSQSGQPFPVWDGPAAAMWDDDYMSPAAQLATAGSENPMNHFAWGSPST